MNAKIISYPSIETIVENHEQVLTDMQATASALAILLLRNGASTSAVENYVKHLEEGLAQLKRYGV